MKLLFAVCNFITLILLVGAKNILFVSDAVSPSHHIFNSALARKLATSGHNVTFLSADLAKIATDNLHYIHLEYQYKAVEEVFEKAENGGFDYNGIVNINKFLFILMMQGLVFDGCTVFGKNEGFKTLMNYPDDFKFDLMIYDYSVSPCALGLLRRFNYPPLIGISPFCNPPSTVDILGGDRLGLTTKPHYLLNYDINMNLIQRFHNAFMNFFESMVRKYYSMPKYYRQMQGVYGNDLPYAGELEKFMQIAFVNSHPSIEFAESLPPNVIEVAGLHLRDSKPLEKDLDEFLSAGKKGSIIMSLGTNFRSDTLGEAKINAIVEAFRELKEYNFIWKFETSNVIKNLPSNVRIQPWLSQNDILGHSNVKAFITHGGMLSIQEAVYHGKPFIGIPLFSDQMRNVQNAIYGGVAIRIDFDKITKENVKKSVLEIMENSKYRTNMKNRSKLFKDQPRKPLDLALWWCEYIMRNPNSNHLKPSEFNFGLLSSHFWDVQCILILIIILIYYNLKWVLSKLFKRKSVDVKIKRN